MTSERGGEAPGRDAVDEAFARAAAVTGGGASAPGPLLVVALLALLCLVWGSTWLVIATGLDDLPPMLAVGTRFVIAGAVMAAIAPAVRRREGGAPPGTRLALIAAVGEFGVSYGLVYWAETIVASGLVAVLWATYPLFMALCGHAFLEGERLGLRALAGFVVGFVGVALLFWTDLQAFGEGASLAGAGVIFGAFVTAFATTAIKREAKGTSSALLNRDGMLLAGVLFLALSAATESWSDARWTTAAWGSVLYLALFGTVLTFGVYFWLLRHVAASRLSLIAYLIPLVALVLGAAFGDEPVGAYTLAGTALVLAGVGAAVGRRGGAH